jgi:hypothetical protein
MKKKLLIVLLVIANMHLSRCQHKKYTMDKFDWSHTLSAPKNYPMRIYQATLKGLRPEDYSASYGMWGIVNEGWGEESGSVAVGPELKAVPDSLLITWLSLRENKFYTGSFKLPREQMIRLFDEGFYEYDLRARDTYTDILVGMAPGGVVVVWLTGGQVRTEVARFQTEETTIDKTMVNSNNKDMFKDGYVDFVLNNRKIEKAPIPFGLWDTYREKYSWRPQLVLEKGSRIAETWMTMYNGEKEHVFVQDPRHEDYQKRALPQYIGFTWRNENGVKYYGKVFFDEEEIFNAFKAIFRNDKEQKANIVFEPDIPQKSFSIILHGKTEEIRLEKIRNKVYPSKD